jgi:hypothetical protein
VHFVIAVVVGQAYFAKRLRGRGGSGWQ